MIINRAYIEITTEFVLKSLMDTVLNKKLISDFYESNKNNFKLREPLFKIHSLVFH